MANLTPTDTERLTALEQLVQVLQGRIEALEVREAQRELKDAGLSPTEGAYLQEQLLGAVAGSKDAESLNHFQ